MKHDLTTRTWQDDTGCPISIILVSTSDAVPSLCRPPVVLSPIALVVPRVAIFVPCHCAARCPADPCHRCVARRRCRAARCRSAPCRCCACAARHRRRAASSCHPSPRPAESCRPLPFSPLPSSCRPQLSSCRVVVLPVAVIVPRRRAARRRRCAACCPAAHCRRRVARLFRPRRHAVHRHCRVTRLFRPTLAVFVPPVAVIVPRHCAACRLQRRLQRRLRCPAAGCLGLLICL